MPEEHIEINLPVEAFIPSFYIPNEEEKISMYQKLAGSEEEALLAEFETDLLDEFGPLPREVQNLFRILRLKMACRQAGVLRVKAEIQGKEKRDIILTLASRVTAEQIIPLLAAKPQWKVSGSTLRVSDRDLGEDWLSTLQESVALLATSKKRKK